MKKCWFEASPDGWLIRNDFGATHIYEDTGKTLADDCDWYFQVPILVAWIYEVVSWLHTRVSRFVMRYKT